MTDSSPSGLRRPLPLAEMLDFASTAEPERQWKFIEELTNGRGKFLVETAFALRTDSAYNRERLFRAMVEDILEHGADSRYIPPMVDGSHRDPGDAQWWLWLHQFEADLCADVHDGALTARLLSICPEAVVAEYRDAAAEDVKLAVLDPEQGGVGTVPATVRSGLEDLAAVLASVRLMLARAHLLSLPLVAGVEAAAQEMGEGALEGFYDDKNLAYRDVIDVAFEVHQLSGVLARLTASEGTLSE